MNRTRGLLAAVAVVALTGVGAVAGVGTGSAAVRTPVGAQTVSPINSFDATAHVVSTTGHHLQFELFSQPGNVQLRLTRVGVGKPRPPLLFPGESHTWGFFGTPLKLVYDQKTGRGSLQVGRAMRPYARVKVVLKATGPLVTVGCQQRQPVAVTGTVRLDTHSTGPHAWGTVGGDAHPIVFSTASHVDLPGSPGAACGKAAHLPCAATIDWSAPYSADTTMQSSSIRRNGHAFTWIDADRNVQLKYNGVLDGARDDAVLLYTPPPVLTSSGSTARMVIRPAHVPGVNGSARITASGRTAASETCGRGRAHRLSGSEWTGSWTDGSHPLTVTEQIEGRFRVAHHSQGATINRLRPTS